MKTLAESDPMVAAIFGALGKFPHHRDVKRKAIHRANALICAYEMHGSEIDSSGSNCDAEFIWDQPTEVKELVSP